jgi:macrophage erythroblast attacher
MKTAKAVVDRQGLEVSRGSFVRGAMLILQHFTDTKLFAELIKVETALVQKQSVAEALAWCGENRGTLKKTKVSECRGWGSF